MVSIHKWESFGFNMVNPGKAVIESQSEIVYSWGWKDLRTKKCYSGYCANLNVNGV